MPCAMFLDGLHYCITTGGGTLLQENLNGNFLLLATALDLRRRLRWKALKVISKEVRDRVRGRLGLHLLSTRAALHAQEETAGLATSLVRVLRK